MSLVHADALGGRSDVLPPGADDGLRVVGATGPGPVEAISVDQRMATLLSMKGIDRESLRGLPVDRDSELLVGNAPHSAPGAVYVLVTSRDTVYLLEAPDQDGYRNVTRSGKLPLPTNVGGLQGVSVKDFESFSARVLNGAANIDPADGNILNVDMQSLSRANLPVGQALQLQLRDHASNAIETVGLIDGARSFSVDRS